MTNCKEVGNRWEIPGFANIVVGMHTPTCRDVMWLVDTNAILVDSPPLSLHHYCDKVRGIAHMSKAINFGDAMVEPHNMRTKD